jgi:phosphatidylserine decarboxylase
LIAREGFPFIGAGMLMTALAWLASQQLSSWFVYPAVALAIVTLFVVYFFRDPERTAPDLPGAIISAADGKVVAIDQLEKDEDLGAAAIRVSIFLSIFDVHVNRIPIAGSVDSVERRSGRFGVAYSSIASTTNEQSVITISNDSTKLVVKQIVGILARRICCYLRVGDEVLLGERFGLIRFGSRVDHILPTQTELQVQLGQRVRAGETVIGVHRG